MQLIGKNPVLHLTVLRVIIGWKDLLCLKSKPVHAGIAIGINSVDICSKVQHLIQYGQCLLCSLPGRKFAEAHIFVIRVPSAEHDCTVYGIVQDRRSPCIAAGFIFYKVHVRPHIDQIVCDRCIACFQSDLQW